MLKNLVLKSTLQGTIFFTTHFEEDLLKKRSVNEGNL